MKRGLNRSAGAVEMPSAAKPGGSMLAVTPPAAVPRPLSACARVTCQEHATVQAFQPEYLSNKTNRAFGHIPS